MLKGKRTLILAALAVIGAGVNAYFDVVEADPSATVAVVAMAVLMAVMRAITTTPPFSGGD